VQCLLMNPLVIEPDASIGPRRFRMLVFVLGEGNLCHFLPFILRAFDLTNFTAFCLVGG
jgi:hypothetical protein